MNHLYILFFILPFLLGANCRNLEYYHTQEAVRKELKTARLICRQATTSEANEYCVYRGLISTSCDQNQHPLFVWIGISITNARFISACRPYVASATIKPISMSLFAGKLSEEVPFTFVFAFDDATGNSVVFQNECESFDLGAAGDFIRSDYYQLTANQIDGQFSCEVKPLKNP